MPPVAEQPGVVAPKNWPGVTPCRLLHCEGEHTKGVVQEHTGGMAGMTGGTKGTQACMAELYTEPRGQRCKPWGPSTGWHVPVEGS
jgi:hypothetical protein